MTFYITNKEQITKKILCLIDPDKVSDINYIMKTWWCNFRDTGGLRLTILGDKKFQLANLEYYDFIFDKPNDNNSSLLMLDRRMPCPYYLFFKNKQKIIRVYDSRVALLITLQGGIQNFLKNKEDIHYRWNEND